MAIEIRTEKGLEQYWDTSEFSRGTKNIVFSYGFLANDGSLFQCVETSLEACREARDAWLAETPRKDVFHFGGQKRRED